MADEKKNMGPEEAIVTESPTPENPGGPSVSPAPEQEAEQGTIPGMEEKADPSETVIDLAAARKAVKEQAAPEDGAPPAGPGGGAPGSDGPGGDGGKTPEPEKKPARRGRRPKAEQEAPGGGDPGAAGKAKPGRAAKKEKAPRIRKSAEKRESPPRPERQGRWRRPCVGPTAGAPPAPEPTVPCEPPRSGETEQIVYINLGELHAFKDHPFGVRDDDEMRSLVESVKVGGVNQPALVRPCEDGGYEIIAGHRRQKVSELAGYTKMPCIVREMTDDEAILAMTDDNLRQRSNILPMEKEFSLKMQVEVIKHQGARTSGQSELRPVK